MNQSIPLWKAAGFIFTSILGTFLHFLFDLSGQAAAAALFSAVNESIWEHMKLLYYPMVLFALAEYRFWGREHRGFWCVKLAGISLGLGLIPLIYYAYTGILGVSASWFNVAIFFLSAGAAYYLESRLHRRDSCPLSSRAAIALILLIGLIFLLLTFFPPRIPFFRDPVTGTYGFQG